jgi:hypothetical protein
MVIVAVAVRDPPSPVAVIVYCVVAPGQTSLDPLGLTSPTPWSIETREAFVEDQVSVEHLPGLRETGVAEAETVGAARLQPNRSRQMARYLITLLH